MKKLVKIFLNALLTLIFIVGLNFNLLAIGTWTTIHGGPYADEVMLLLSDGSVMIKTTDCGGCVGNGFGTYWYKLKPDINGSYENGSWSIITTPMSYQRSAFSSLVLKDGRVYVAGGENGNGQGSAEVYDPIANTWTGIPIPSGQTWDFGDACVEILEDGKVLQGIRNFGTYNTYTIYDPATNSFGPVQPVNGEWAEACFIKLPDNSILFNDNILSIIPADDVFNKSERYFQSSQQWKWDADLTGGLVLTSSFVETGGALMLPPSDGRAFFTGATGQTAYYTPGSPMGTWAPGPNIPTISSVPQQMSDAPMAMMVNGKILCAISPITNSYFYPLIYFYEFNYISGTWTPAGAPAGADLNYFTQYLNFINLPNGQVLVSRFGSSDYYVYTPDDSPLTEGKPTISSVTNGGCTYIVTGTLFNGISEGSVVGDESQNATNYPIVQLSAGGYVYYCRTSNWSSTGVQTGSTPESVEFTTPAGLPDGTYDIVVIANGISSDPYPPQFTFSSTRSADLWMMDNPVGEATQYQDFGFEKDDRYNNAPGSQMWTSGDIWVSPTQIASPWANVLGDQSLSYDGSTDNYVYVTVRNRGCSASSGTETLDLHWTKTTSAGVGDWPIYWDGTKTLEDVFPGCGSNTAPVGGLINPTHASVKYEINGATTPTTASDDYNGNITIPVIQQSDVVTFQIPWIGEEPSNYFCLFPGETIPDLLNNEEHFCLLARIQTSATAPFGMTYAEGNPSNVWTNTYNNNKIAWHNISVICSGCRMGGAIVRNPEPNQLVMKLLFNVPPEESTNSFLNYGTVKVDLPHNLFQKWVDGGSVGAEYELCDDTIIKITGPNAWIGNITLDSLEADVVETVFDQYIESPNQCKFNYDIAQYDSSATDTSAHVTGGVRFLINTCSGADARHAAVNPTPSKQNNVTSNYKLYPNPNNGSMQLDYELKQGDQGRLVIYDFTGRQLDTYSLQEGKHTLQISDPSLSSGIYIYEIYDNENRVAFDKFAIVK